MKTVNLKNTQDNFIAKERQHIKKQQCVHLAGKSPCTLVAEDPSYSQGSYETSNQSGQCSFRVGIPCQRLHPLLKSAFSDDQLFCRSKTTKLDGKKCWEIGPLIT